MNTGNKSSGEVPHRSLAHAGLQVMATVSSLTMPSETISPTPASRGTVTNRNLADVPCTCGGLGFVTLDVPPGPPDFGRAVPCPCQLVGMHRERSAKLARRIAEFSGMASAHARAKTFEGFDVLDDNRKAFQSARSFAANPDGWLVLIGGYGCGKTHLLLAIGNALLGQADPQPVVYANTPDLLDSLKATFGRNGDGDTYDERFRAMRTVDVLLLDDLGAESPTSWAAQALYQLLDYRYVHELPTALASNMALGEFPGRIRSRLRDRSVVQVVAVTSGDYRRLKKARRRKSKTGGNL